MKTPEIIIVVEGGVVQEVYADSPVKIRLFDYDDLSECSLKELDGVLTSGGVDISPEVTHDLSSIKEDIVEGLEAHREWLNEHS